MRMLNYATANANPFHRDHPSQPRPMQTYNSKCFDKDSNSVSLSKLKSDRSKHCSPFGQDKSGISLIANPPNSVITHNKDSDRNIHSVISDDTYSDMTFSLATCSISSSTSCEDVISSCGSRSAECQRKKLDSSPPSPSTGFDKKRFMEITTKHHKQLVQCQPNFSGVNLVATGKLSGLTLEETMSLRRRISNGDASTTPATMPSPDSALLQLKSSGRVKKQIAKAKANKIAEIADRERTKKPDFMSVRARLKNTGRKTALSREFGSRDTRTSNQVSSCITEAEPPTAEPTEAKGARYVVIPHFLEHDSGAIECVRFRSSDVTSVSDISSNMHSKISNLPGQLEFSTSKEQSDLSADHKPSSRIPNTNHSTPATSPSKKKKETREKVDSMVEERVYSQFASHESKESEISARKDSLKTSVCIPKAMEENEGVKQKLNHLSVQGPVQTQEKEELKVDDCEGRDLNQGDDEGQVIDANVSSNLNPKAAVLELSRMDAKKDFARIINTKSIQVQSEAKGATSSDNLSNICISRMTSNDRLKAKEKLNSMLSLRMHQDVSHVLPMGRQNEIGATSAQFQPIISSIESKETFVGSTEKDKAKTALNLILTKRLGQTIEHCKNKVNSMKQPQMCQVEAERTAVLAVSSARCTNQVPSELLLIPSKSECRDDIEGDQRRSCSIRDSSESSTDQTKYTKMLKMGIPIGAVKNAMLRDGLDPSEWMGQESEIKHPIKKNKKDPFRRTRLHWVPLKHFSENSIWQQIELDDEEIFIDDAEFRSLFQSKTAAFPTKPAWIADTASEGAVKVIEPKRANNGGIILARLRMSYDDIANSIDLIDDSSLTSQQIIGIMDYIPKSDERKALRNYLRKGNDVNLLCEAEKFMIAIMNVADAKKKMEAILFKLHFAATVNGLESDMDILSNACNDILNSVRLRKFLGVILKIGNRLNCAGVESIEANAVNGFTIESLTKLNQVKALDKKTTILFYIASIIQKWNLPLLNVKEELPNVLKTQNLLDHEASLLQLGQQLENVQLTARQINKSEGGDANGSCEESTFGMFVLDASRTVSELQQKNANLGRKFKSVLWYLAQEETLKPNVLFGIIASFCNDMDKIRVQLIKKSQKVVRMT